MKNCLLVVLMLFTGYTYAGINKWLDENNHVHYSDQPPPSNATARKLTPVADPGPAAESDATTEANGTNTPKTIAEREAEWKKTQKAKQDAADKATQEQAKLDANKANCASAEHSLKVLESGTRITDVDEKGERYFLSEEQLQQRIAKINSDIQSFCK
ncbi:MAG: DUF4124 domain-containing protein [Gallionella sp.]